MYKGCKAIRLRLIQEVGRCWQEINRGYGHCDRIKHCATIEEILVHKA